MGGGVCISTGSSVGGIVILYLLEPVSRYVTFAWSQATYTLYFGSLSPQLGDFASSICLFLYFGDIGGCVHRVSKVR
jgi:hypothetical protein